VDVLACTCQKHEHVSVNKVQLTTTKKASFLHPSSVIISNLLTFVVLSTIDQKLPFFFFFFFFFFQLSLIFLVLSTKKYCSCE